MGIKRRVMKPLPLRAVPRLGLAALAARAGEGAFHPHEDPGVDKVRQNCLACHGFDPIETSSRFLDRTARGALA